MYISKNKLDMSISLTYILNTIKMIQESIFAYYSKTFKYLC